MSDDYIKRSDAIDVLEKLSACKEIGEEIGTEEETYIGKYEAVTAISDLPSVNRPQGEWIIEIDANGDTYGRCSICGMRQYAGQLNFCPYCGAMIKMADNERYYERAVEQMEHDTLYEPAYNAEDGSM